MRNYNRFITHSSRPTYRPTAGPVTVGAQPPPNKSALPPTYNPYVVEKKNQVLDQIAKQKKATKEAKGRVLPGDNRGQRLGFVDFNDIFPYLLKNTGTSAF